MTADCDPTCPVETGFYNYDPSIAGNAVLLTAYGLLIPAVLYPGFRFSTIAFSVILALGLALDVVGFTGRLLLNRSPARQDFFALSLVGTILGPTFISGAVVLTLPRTLSLCGGNVSSLRRFFAALLLFASTAGAGILEVVGIVFVSYNVGGLGRSGGAELIAGGLGVQVIALLGFVGLHFWFITRVIVTKWSVVNIRHAAVCRTGRFKRFLFGTGAASILLLAYSIYRIIEIVQGLQGQLFQNQIVFVVVNGALPLVAASLVTVFQPGAAFGRRWKSTSPLHLRRSRAVPPPLKSGRQQMEQRAHHRYDPDIRKQLSPGSQRSDRRSNPPEMPKGSPGLPANPRPIYKMATASPMPSPTGTAGTAGTVDRGPSRLSQRSETRETKKMVEKDSLW